MTMPSKITAAVPLPAWCRGLIAATVLLLAPVIAVAEGRKAPPASLEEPPPPVLSELPYPSAWTWISWKAGGLDYRIDLDLLAPLGTGGGNLATWLGRLMVGGPEREMALRRARNVEIPGLGDWSPLHFVVSERFGDSTLLPFDDPLLLEAEPWIDQRTCRFYPDVFAYQDIDARPFDFSVGLLLGRTWIARGLARPGPASAAEADVRRAVRLGRLLLQDDVTVLQNLVGMALIRAGAAGLYALARRSDNGAGAALATLVLVDSAELRAETIRRKNLTGEVVAHFIQPRILGRLTGPVLEINGFEVDEIIKLADSLSSRALRLEALNALYLIMHMGSRSQSERATFALGRLAGVADPIVAAAARKLRKREFDKSLMFMPGLVDWPVE